MAVMQPIPCAILISGRGSNMEAISNQVQKGILKDVLKIRLVLSNKASADGLEYAQQQGYETVVCSKKGLTREEYGLELIKILNQYNIQLIILAGFMLLLPDNVIEAYEKKIINIHPADSKAYQGMHGYQWAFDNKMNSTKITIHYVDAGMDTGPIIAQREFEIGDCQSVEEVSQRGLAIEHEFYSQILLNVATTMEQ